jgi:hypothetical protein
LNTIRISIVCVALGSVCAPATAQTVLQSFVGAAQNDSLGFSVANCGDIDGDGVADLVAGAPGVGLVGGVFVYSAASGALLHSIVPGSPVMENYGSAVAGAGDVDGDGVPDILIGAEGDFFDAGAATRVEVRSGADTSLLRLLVGPTGSRFGDRIAVLGDWNSDGRQEFAVGAPDADFNLLDSGSVFVFDGDPALSTPIFRMDGEDSGSYLGSSVALADDVNGDGAPDIAASSPTYPVNATYPLGQVLFFSGESGELLRTIDGPLNGTFGPGFGLALANLGDIDGDGFADFVVGGPYYGITPIPTSSEGIARIHSSRTGAVLFEAIGEQADQRLGQFVGSLGDIDGDGVGDYSISGAQGAPTKVFSGRTRQLKYSINTGFFGYLGHASCSMGDVNGDGIDDFAMSDPGHQQSRGRVRIFAGSPSSVSSYCTSGTTSNGCAPRLIGVGSPSATGASAFTLSITGLEGQKPGLLFYGVSGPKLAPWGATSSYLCVDAPTQRTQFSFPSGTPDVCNGVYLLDWNAYVAGHPGALGLPFNPSDQVWAQGWFRDPPSSKQTSLTNALSFSMEP